VAAMQNGQDQLTPGRSLKIIPTPIFQPFVFNGMVLKNRLGSAPIQHCKYKNGNCFFLIIK
jgi:hypothetical protein